MVSSETSLPRRPDVDYTRHALVVLGIAAVCRALFFLQFGPGPDEAFYWLWSRHLDFGYVEHPPMIALAIRAMRALFGENAAAWRFLADAAAFGTGWCLFATGRLLFGARVGFWAATAHAASPILSMAGGSILVPGSLVLCIVSLGIYCAARLVRSGDMRWFLPLGVVLGCGLLTKLPALLIPAALGLFALLSPAHRHWFRRPQPYMMVLIAAVMFSPVIYWNATHDWIGLSFVAERSEVKAAGGPSAAQLFLGSLLGQAAYHSPVLFVMCWMAAGIGVYRGIWEKDERWLLLACFSAPAMVAFQVLSAIRFTLPHWPLSAYLSAYVMLPAFVFAGEGVKHRLRRIFFGVGITLGAVFSLVIPALVLYPLTTLAGARLQRLTGAPTAIIEPMSHAVGWREEIRAGILAQRARLASETGEAPVVLTHFHMLAAILAYGLHPDCDVVCVHAQAHQFDLWYGDEDLVDRSVLFVSSDAFLTSAGRAGRPQDYYLFESCTELAPISVVRHGVTINTIHLWHCTGYHGPAPTPGPRI